MALLIKKESYVLGNGLYSLKEYIPEVEKILEKYIYTIDEFYEDWTDALDEEKGELELIKKVLKEVEGFWDVFIDEDKDICINKYEIEKDEKC